MKKILLLLAVLLATPCAAQQLTVVQTTPPCTTFGTTAGTCAQGGVITAAGPTGSATVAPIITYNAAGQLTAVTSATVTPAVGSITGLGTNVAAGLAATVGAATGFTAVQVVPTSYTVTDQSGASLTFTSIATRYQEVSNVVDFGGSFVWPSTADGSSVSVSVPVAVPNQAYAQVTCAASANVAFPTAWRVQPNTSTMFLYNTTTSSRVTNVAMSGATSWFSCRYFAQ